MKDHLVELVRQAWLDLRRDGQIPDQMEPDIEFERTRSPEHGDLATNVAMRHAKALETSPRDLAQAIAEQLPASAMVEKVEVAGPGFINFYLADRVRTDALRRLLEQGAEFAHSDMGQGTSITVEFVSANPTGPLHVGHGRGAAFGATVSNLLAAAGFQVQREYYVNDAGRQMDILAVSAWLRYQELCGEGMDFPAEAYQGDYVYDIARELRMGAGDDLRRSPADIRRAASQAAGRPWAEVEGEARLDALVLAAKKLLGEEGFEQAHEAALSAMLADIREDLSAFEVHYDNWFSEAELVASGAIDQAIEQLRAADQLYDQDGATVLKASELGDEKDRVVVRSNGQPTYFASDLAYMKSKLDRFDRALYILGADHHGYVPRLQAAAQGLGLDADRLEFLLVQFAVLTRGGEKLPMGTRSGKFVPLRELREEVGNDAARYFYVMRGNDQHLEFDLDLATRRSQDNPVYYAQYAHARVASLFDKLREKGLNHNEAAGISYLKDLDQDQEVALIDQLIKLPEIVELAARNRAPQTLEHYLRDTAGAFHSFYNACPILADEVSERRRDARLSLARASQIVFAECLRLLGVSAPEQM